MASNNGDELSIAIASDADVVRVRQLVRSLATQAGLTLVDQTKLITAASELARNTLIHGGGGSATMSIRREGRRSGVSVTFVDDGPGIVVV
jgi:serine/threonine-protein kinase RsbT